MSIFGSIMSAIFGSHPATAQPQSGTASPVPPSAVDAVSNPPTNSASSVGVDVAEMLTTKATQAGQTLDWQHSIVDLMKLLGLDSSLAARKELAGELHYTGDTDNSSSMNMWLHSEVMQKISENGGKVPVDLITKQ